MPITTKVASLNSAQGEVYTIQQYVIKFVIDLRQVGGFSPGTPVYSNNKTHCHDIIKRKKEKKEKKRCHMFEGGVKHHNTNHNPRYIDHIMSQNQKQKR